MSAFELVRGLVHSNTRPKPIKFSHSNPNDKKNKLTVKMAGAPADYSDAAVETAAHSQGVTATETVALATGAKETRGRETVAGEPAVAIIRGLRGITPRPAAPQTQPAAAAPQGAKPVAV